MLVLMYEVERKVEITRDEREKLVALFRARGYRERPLVMQEDAYIEAKKSPFGGYDHKRYRKEGDRIIYTEKSWEDAPGGGRARREIERDADEEERAGALSLCAAPIIIRKERLSFEGEHDGRAMHIDMDSVAFSHSPDERCFIEAELIARTKDDVSRFEDAVWSFLRDALGRDDLVESPGMFTMAFEKR